MNLFPMLKQREQDGNPIRVGLIGAGKFGAMFLSQAHRTPGILVVAVADLDTRRVHAALTETGWPAERISTSSLTEALAKGKTAVTDDPMAMIETNGLDVIIDATGDPEAGIRHALHGIEHGRHMIMVNVEADVLAGPLLSQKAQAAGVVFSMAYGDQPALICEQLDWARTCGLDVVAAGKGTLYMPEFHASTPDTVWGHYGLTPERAAENGLNPKMFNSFLDGTKSAIEMAAVANATGLTPSANGLEFPPCSVDDLSSTLIPAADGGCLDHKGQVEVISSRSRDGIDLVNDLRWGVYVTFEAPSDYVERCFSDYGVKTDTSGRYASLWRPSHLIGLELGVSVAYAGLLGQATGMSQSFNADVVATTKKDLIAGDTLDGEGGYSVWGKLMPASLSLKVGALPIGLAHGVTLKTDIAEGAVVRWADVNLDETRQSVCVRREMEQFFGNN